MVEGRGTSVGRARGCLLLQMQAVREGKALQVMGSAQCEVAVI